MNLEVFLTILGVLLAIYSLATETIKARVSTFISPYFWLISIGIYSVILLSVLLLEHYWKYPPFSDEVLFWIQFLLYFFFFVGCWHVYSRYKAGRLTKRNISHFYQYLKVLLLKKEYALLTEVIYESLSDILSHYHQKKADTKSDKKVILINMGPESITLPVADEYTLEAEFCRRIFRDIIFNEQFIKSNVLYGKQFAIDLIRGCREKKIGISEYTDLFLYELIKNHDSFLYSEIRETHTTYNPSNDESLRFPFLNVLFEDIKFFDDEGFYRGIGEYVIEFIDRNLEEHKDRYNHTSKYYWSQNDRDERHKCPIWVSLSFFGTMVERGIEANLHSHLWLLYVSHWAKSICKQVTYFPEEWRNGREFPTIYYYLLYEIISTHRYWIDSIYRASAKETYGTEYPGNDKAIEISDARKHVLEWILKDLLYCADVIAQCTEIPPDKRVHLLQSFMEINIGIMSNFSHYGKTRVAVVKDVKSPLDAYLQEFRQALLRKNYADVFNHELHEMCQSALNSMDKIPLSQDACKFWEQWLSDVVKK